MESIICDLCRYLLDNINEEITMDQVEEVFHYNRYYLIRTFKLYTGYTMKEFINTVKVLQTINPLLFTNDTILKIALNNGFNSLEYYSEKFQDVIGISPLYFRKEYQSLENKGTLEEIKAKRDYLEYLNACQNQLLNMPNQLVNNVEIQRVLR